MMLVTSNGNMTWIPPVIYKSSCQVFACRYKSDCERKQRSLRAGKMTQAFWIKCCLGKLKRYSVHLERICTMHHRSPHSLRSGCILSVALLCFRLTWRIIHLMYKLVPCDLARGHTIPNGWTFIFSMGLRYFLCPGHRSPVTVNKKGFCLQTKWGYW